VTVQALDDSRFSPAAFFALAGTRLSRAPAPAGDPARGDDILNPGFHAEERSFTDAAVLVPIVARHPEASVILTLRTPHLSAHAGQIAFPGGKIDPEDAGPAEAAIREAGEEIGLAPESIEPIGYLDPYLTGTGFRIVPVVAKIAPSHRLAINPKEVDSAFEVPLGFLMDPSNHRQGSREFMGTRRYFYEMPFGERYIWGITAGIIRGLYERVFG
jgi:8-oxo-dGTP pyrophosphatase MutT (NUDIX family)